jgi:hypothetical protein
MKKATPINDQKTELVGQFFHSIKDGQVHWQGSIIGNPEPGWYLLQLYEWGFGQPNVQRLVKIEDMAGWLFYDTTEGMQYSYDHGVAREGGPYRKEMKTPQEDGGPQNTNEEEQQKRLSAATAATLSMFNKDIIKDRELDKANFIERCEAKKQII